MKTKVFSLTKKDFEWDFYRGKGKGGQKKNVTDSACRCKHLPSGALAYAEKSRSQHINKRKAFERIIATRELREWIRIEVARRSGGELIDIEEQVNLAMHESNLKIETFIPKDKK